MTLLTYLSFCGVYIVLTILIANMISTMETLTTRGCLHIHVFVLSAAIEDLLRSNFRQAILMAHAVVLTIDDSTIRNTIFTSVQRRDREILELKTK